MRYPRSLAALTLAGVVLIALGSNGGAAPALPFGLSSDHGLSVIEFVQDKPRSETVTQQVKRIWRNLTGYRFDVACPAFAFALTRTTCTANGKNRDEARAKCQSQNVFCQIGDSNHY